MVYSYNNSMKEVSNDRKLAIIIVEYKIYLEVLRVSCLGVEVLYENKKKRIKNNFEVFVYTLVEADIAKKYQTFIAYVNAFPEVIERSMNQFDEVMTLYKNDLELCAKQRQQYLLELEHQAKLWEDSEDQRLLQKIIK